MLNTVERYLVLRRAAGFAMQSAECLLKSFASFAAERGETHVRAQTAIDWAAFGPSVAQRDARLKAVCRFARAIRIEDKRHQEPPANYFGARKKRRPPHIYSAEEINRLIEGALRLQPKGGLRCQTYRAARGHGAADLRSVEAEDRRHDPGRAADPGDQVPENAPDAAA